MIINFHHFHNNNNIPQYVEGSISESTFENFIINNIEIIINIDIWLEKYKNNTLTNQIAITLDDGLLCQYEIALPILNKYNIKAGWGIYTSPLINQPIFLELYKYFQGLYFNNDNDFYNEFFNIIMSFPEYANNLNNINKINNYRKNLKFYTFNDRKFRYIRDNVLSQNEFTNIIIQIMKNKNFILEDNINNIWINTDNLKNISKTQIICSHSHTHPTMLQNLDYKSQLEEIEQSINIIKNILNIDINIFCCPCDNFNNDTLKILKKKNIICLAGDIHSNSNYVIKRIDCNKFIK